MTGSFIFGIVLAGLILALLIFIFSKAYVFLFKQSSIFGASVKTRLLGLAITSVFFSEGVITLFLWPLKSLIRVLSLLYSNVSQGFAVINDNSAPELAFRMINYLYEASNFQAITSVIIALALWAVTGQIIDSYNSVEVQSSQLKHKARQSLILGLLFVVSIYLSLAAIIAVPYFLEDDKLIIENGRIEARLDTLSKNNVGDHFALPDKPSYLIRPDFREAILAIGNKEFRNKANEVLERIEASLQLNMETRATADRLLSEQKVTYRRAIKTAYNDVLNKYSEEEPNLKSKLKLTYINQLTRWFENRSRFALAESDQIREIVRTADRQYLLAQTNFNSDFRSLLNYMAKDTVENLDANLKYNTDPNNYRTSIANYYSELDHLQDDNLIIEESTPAAPVPGQELGIFRGLSQWLLKPRYMALVLIVGMLGFGLFGSAVSTFVKGNIASAPDNSIDITGVVVRGVSAAIVIFLAVKGGVSVFIQGETELNPYSLFLTCLIGAVYSERVWHWAKQQLEDRFTGNGNQTEQVTTSSEEQIPQKE